MPPPREQAANPAVVSRQARRGRVRLAAAWPRLRGPWLAVGVAAVLAAGSAWAAVCAPAPGRVHRIGEVVDVLDGVPVFYNGRIGQTWGRTVAPDGYNVGLRYQCVEFVKRYYRERFRHRMPDPWGHARDLFDPAVPDAGWNARRGLVQFTNPSRTPPRHGDIVVFRERAGNPYGHVAIVSRVDRTAVELVQQNPGAAAPARIRLPLDSTTAGWRIGSARALGWLRMRGP